MTQRMTLITSTCFIPEARLKEAGSFQALFGNDRPLVLEIGCGIGDFIIQVATRQPEYNYIAIDIFNRGCKQTSTRIQKAGLANILMLRMEGRYLMREYLSQDSLQAIYINCPDPWPKKRQRKRRLVNQEFLNMALYYLKEDGDLFFTTDFDDYGESASKLLIEESRFENCHESAYTHELGDYPVSKYMRRFLDRGQPIYFCHYRKKRGLTVPKPPLQKGFRMSWVEEDA